MPLRYNVVTENLPASVRKLGFVAYVTDERHPDREPGDSALSVSWHTTLCDAERTRRALELSQQTNLSDRVLR